MANEVKTKKDLEQDVVGVVYGIVGFFKALFWIALFSVGMFFLMMFTAKM